MKQDLSQYIAMLASLCGIDPSKVERLEGLIRESEEEAVTKALSKQPRRLPLNG